MCVCVNQGWQKRETRFHDRPGNGNGKRVSKFFWAFPVFRVTETAYFWPFLGGNGIFHAVSGRKRHFKLRFCVETAFQITFLSGNVIFNAVSE
jgi:hypothetical protein